MSGKEENISHISVPQECSSCSRTHPRGPRIPCWCKSTLGLSEGIPTLGMLVWHMISVIRRKEEGKSHKSAELNEQRTEGRGGESTDATFGETGKNGSDPLLVGGRCVGTRGGSGAGLGFDNHRRGGWVESRVDGRDAAEALADPARYPESGCHPPKKVSQKNSVSI